MAATKQSMEEKTATVYASAWGDKSYEARLMDRPREVLREAGIPVPPGVTIHVHRNSPTELHIVIPEKPDVGRVVFVTGAGRPAPEATTVDHRRRPAKKGTKRPTKPAKKIPGKSPKPPKKSVKKSAKKPKKGRGK